jgi:ferredoxin
LKASANETVAQLLEKAENWEGPAFVAPDSISLGGAPALDTDSSAPVAAEVSVAATAALAEDDDDDDMGNEPYIDTIRCTSCDDCLKINTEMFVYNDDQQAYISDPGLGTFKQLVVGAEACPAECIHPGDPLDPKEKGLDKLIKRAEPFN